MFQTTNQSCFCSWKKRLVSTTAAQLLPHKWPANHMMACQIVVLASRWWQPVPTGFLYAHIYVHLLIYLYIIIYNICIWIYIYIQYILVQYSYVNACKCIVAWNPHFGQSSHLLVEHPVSNHRPGVQHSMMFCLPGIAGRWSISHAANITINSAVQPETAVHVQPQTCDFLTCTLSIHFRDLPADFLRSCHFLGGGKIRKICPCSAFWAILIGPDRSW